MGWHSSMAPQSLALERTSPQHVEAQPHQALALGPSWGVLPDQTATLATRPPAPFCPIALWRNENNNNF